MKRADYKTALDKIVKEAESVADEKVRSILTGLVNLVESLIIENDQLREENRQLRDENSRLKGEQPKPKIRKQTTGGGNKDFSSENERNKRNKKNRKKKSKKK